MTTDIKVLRRIVIAIKAIDIALWGVTEKIKDENALREERTYLHKARDANMEIITRNGYYIDPQYKLHRLEKK
jgi:hypothetical protein